MVTRFTVLCNDFINVSLNRQSVAVAVCTPDGGNTRLFAFDGVIELYEAFNESVSEETTYQDAISFFSPALGKVYIGGAEK